MPRKGRQLKRQGRRASSLVALAHLPVYLRSPTANRTAGKYRQIGRAARRSAQRVCSSSRNAMPAKSLHCKCGRHRPRRKEQRLEQAKEGSPLGRQVGRGGSALLLLQLLLCRSNAAHESGKAKLRNAAAVGCQTARELASKQCRARLCRSRGRPCPRRPASELGSCEAGRSHTLSPQVMGWLSCRDISHSEAGRPHRQLQGFPRPWREAEGYRAGSRRARGRTRRCLHAPTGDTARGGHQRRGLRPNQGLATSSPSPWPVRNADAGQPSPFR